MKGELWRRRLQVARAAAVLGEDGLEEGDGGLPVLAAAVLDDGGAVLGVEERLLLGAQLDGVAVHAVTAEGVGAAEGEFADEAHEDRLHRHGGSVRLPSLLLLLLLLRRRSAFVVVLFNDVFFGAVLLVSFLEAIFA